MKRIILGLSLLLMLVQNGFARSDAEWDKMIANEPDKVWKQIYKCNKAALNHPDTGDVNECLKSIELKKKNPNSEFDNAIGYISVGQLYYNSEKNYIKAYEYWMKAAKIGKGQVSKVAQRNLDMLCRDHSWVCK